jgi:coenzyme PQQ precursor peptide PqqA
MIERRCRSGGSIAKNYKPHFLNVQVACQYAAVVMRRSRRRPCSEYEQRQRGTVMWSTPVLIEICVGLEINGYLPAEF